MAQIQSDTPEIERYLQDLERVVVSAGGSVLDTARIVAENGEFRVEGPPPRATDKFLFEVAEDIMPAPMDYEIVLQGDDLVMNGLVMNGPVLNGPDLNGPVLNALVLDGNRREVSDAQTQCMELLLALYNLTGKAAHQKRICPWVLLAEHTEVLETLFEARSSDIKLAKLNALFLEGRQDELLIESFLSSRWLVLPGDSARPDTAVVMPFIDLLNHHSAATGYMSQVGSDGQRQVVTANAQPLAKTESDTSTQTDENSNECFVYYNRMDRFDSMLHYGFIDGSTSFVRSIPMKLELRPGVELVIHASTGGMTYKKPPEKEVIFLETLMPEILSGSDSHVEVSFICVPGPAERDALRVILGSLIQLTGMEPNTVAFADAVLRSEAEVVTHNLSYLRRLKVAVFTLPNEGDVGAYRSELLRLIAIQSTMLNSYAQHFNLSTSTP